MSAGEEIDTGNYQGVSECANGVAVLFPRQRMTKAEALVHAAWIVAIADENLADFAKVLAAVRST